MKSPSKRVYSLVAGLALAGILSSGAAELRKWTDIEGREIEASLVEVDGDKVVLKLKNGRTAEVKTTRLSAVDLEWIKEYGGGQNPFGNDGKDPKVESPARKAKIDTKAFVRPDKILKVTNLEFGEVIESEHFVVATSSRIKMKDTAEHAERMWHDMAFFHPNFKARFRDGKKMLIIVVDNQEDWETIGMWYAELIAGQGRGDDANDMLKTWPPASGSGVQLPGDVANEYDLVSTARAYKVTDEKQWEGVWSPFRTHTLAGALLGFQASVDSRRGGEGGYWFSTGHSYYKEISLTGETRTTMIRMDDIEEKTATSELFGDGKNWPSGVKKLVRRKAVNTDLKALYAVERKTATPEDTVLAFAFSYFLQSTQSRVFAFMKLVERVESGSQVPSPVELAKIYGYRTEDGGGDVTALNEAWVEFMKSSAFK